MTGKEDPRPIVDGTEEIVAATLEAFSQPSIPKVEKPKQTETPDRTSLDRLLDRIPADLRDKVTVQVGSVKVKKPGQEPNLSEKNAKILDNVLDTPNLVKGSVKILGENNETLMQIAGGEFVADKIGFGPQKQELKTPTEAIAPQSQTLEPVLHTPPTQTVERPADYQAPATPILVTPQESERMIEAITRLESRVAALEQQIANKPIKLANPRVSGWINAQRDRLAATVRQNVDKVAVKGHSIADKIAATKQTVVDVADAYKQAAVTAVDDLKQSFNDGKAAIVDGTALVKDVVVQGAKDAVNDGMSRHYEAMDSLVGKVNHSAANIADGTKAAIADPRQTFFDKVLQPTVERMFKGAEKLGKIEKDGNGNDSVTIGPYRYSKEQTGFVMRRGDEVLTPQNMTREDAISVKNMGEVFPAPTQKVDKPKLTSQKHKVAL